MLTSFSPLFSLSSLCLLSVTKGPGGLRLFSLNTLYRCPAVRKKMNTSNSSTQLNTPTSHHHIVNSLHCLGSKVTRRETTSRDEEKEEENSENSD